MKVSQEGIEWVKENPWLVKKIKWWLKAQPSSFMGYCPLTKGTGCAGKTDCKMLCGKIWPRRRCLCPCNSYGKRAVIQIAKQIVGEEATNVK